jgi:hypothetical protein
MEKMGKLAKDRITGFQGVIIGRADYLFGCTQYCIAPQAEKNEIKDAHWFDEGRVEVIGEGVTVEEVTGEKPGGPNPYNPAMK